MLESIKKRTAAARILEEHLYEQVVNELANGQRRNGLWAKAIAKSNGQEEKAKALYIQYRVQSLKDEYEILRGRRTAEERSKETPVTHVEKRNIQRDIHATQDGSTVWIHVVVWLIAALFLFAFSSQ